LTEEKYLHNFEFYNQFYHEAVYFFIINHLLINILSRHADAELNSKLSEVYAQLQHIESDKAPARASIILAGLGFSPEKQMMPTKTFSGGWRMRLALARALFSKCVNISIKRS
jgi:ATPase subunit of ABC transporter with duplicated ATPase domains